MRTPNHFKNIQGFTLLELMIVVAIIGILAAIAIPSLRDFMIKAKRAESVVGLGGVYDSLISYKAEKGIFTTSMYELGITMGGPPTYTNLYCLEGSLFACGKYFAFYIEFASPNTFGAKASGYIDPLNTTIETYGMVFP